MRHFVLFAALITVVALQANAGVIRQSVRTFSKSGDTQLRGDVTISEGNNVTLTQVGQNIAISATSSSSGSVTLSVRSVSSGYQLVSTDDVILGDATSGNFPVTLTAATGSGKLFYIKKIDGTTNGISVTPRSGDTIDGSTSEMLDIPNINMPIIDGGLNKWYVL